MVSTAHLRARLGTDRLMVQPVAMSVMVNVQVVLARREAAVVGDQLGLGIGHGDLTLGSQRRHQHGHGGGQDLVT